MKIKDAPIGAAIHVTALPTIKGKVVRHGEMATMVRLNPREVAIKRTVLDKVTKEEVEVESTFTKSELGLWSPNTEVTLIKEDANAEGVTGTEEKAQAGSTRRGKQVASGDGPASGAKPQARRAKRA